MFLKKIEIHGFKSFADKIEVAFDKGVTGIVGPNGSGKSNISDAVRWVLGEQSAKTLRGSRMEDIIFAGTTQRKPVGMAEVSLTLDNTSNRLSIDYAEVTVTRRVYRSGESEYYINKSLCRLKDIREIFMDTGVGVDGYSIIGQGRIDEILSNKSGDRRLLFEEAAGIVKYKTRKEEAEKKLENTNQNLTRVDDIIKELESRIEPLKVQSEKAKNFLDIQGQLKDLEIGLSIHEIEALKYNIEALKEQENIISNQLNNYIKDKDQIEKKHSNLKNKIEILDESIQQLQNNIFETMHLIEKKDGELGLCNEKACNISKNVERLENEIAEMDKNNTALSCQLEKTKDDLKEMDNLLFHTQRHLGEKLKDLKAITSVLEKQEEEMEKSKGNVIEILNNTASKKSQMHTLIALQTNIEKRRRQIEDEKLNLELKKNNVINRKEEVLDELANMEKSFDSLKLLRSTLEVDSKNLYQWAKESKEKGENLKQKLHEHQTKKGLLEEMEKEYEGFSKSVKNTLIHGKKNPSLGRGILGVVAELINVPKGLEIAIEVALGSAMQNIVCQSAEDANRVIEYLKKNNMGRVTFLPLDSIKQNHSSSDILRDFDGSEGLIGLAMDLVGFSEEYKNIMQYLLGKVVLVDKIENGILLAKKMRNKFKIVSLEGDIINPGGSITGGSYRSKTLNILSRKREIEELESNIGQLNLLYQEQSKIIFDNGNKLNELKNQIEQKDILLKEKEIQLINIKNTQNQLVKEIENYQENIHRINTEIDQLSKDYDETKGAIQVKKEEIQKLELHKEDIETRVSNSKSSYELERSQREKLSNEVTNLKVDKASQEQKKQNILKEIESFVAKSSELNNLKIFRQNEIQQLLKIKDTLIEQLNNLKIEMKDADVLKQQYEFNLSQIKGNRMEIFQSFEEVEIQFKKINEIISELQDSNHKMEVKLTRLEMQQETYCNKLWTDYEITYLEALEYKKENMNTAESSKEIKSLKTKIKNLGSINVSAIEEYREVLERYEFLVVQKNDLITAKKSLNRVIHEMENTMRSQFVESFTKIKNNFDDVFKKLFGGGKAELKLEDENEILTTGIEIIAQPPGKKLQNLSLLSGGERALTAIALLFAILMVKPTPFCILDEIEAALDDANVYRYADFLKAFSIETQFIVVTHRKGTMESVDALYGVTMEEYGVSKLVSVKLTEKAS